MVEVIIACFIRGDQQYMVPADSSVGNLSFPKIIQAGRQED